MPRDNRCMYMAHACFMSVVVTVWGYVGMFYCILDLSCEYDVISLYFMCYSVNGSVYLVCLSLFVNYLENQFAICLGVVAILWLNVMEVFSVGGGALFDRPCMVFQIMCVLCL